MHNNGVSQHHQAFDRESCVSVDVVYVYSLCLHRDTMYEFSDRELRDLIDNLPRVVYAKEHPPIRVKLLGVRRRTKYRRWK